MTSPASHAPRPILIRSLGLYDATMLVVGCIVGVGIFRTASSIAGHLQSPILILALWVFGGLLSLCGALCYAELAAMFPASGGDYVYTTKIYGRFWGFLFGWTKLFIERTGTIAILGFVFAEYFRRVLPYGDATLHWVAAGSIVLLTFVNVAGVRWGKYVQNVFTTLKILALLCLIIAGARALLGHHAIAADWAIPPLSLRTLQSAGVALVFVLWTYGGWTEAAYVAEEVRDPIRSVPRAIIGGVILTTILYLFVNWSYLVFVPIDQLSKTPLVASRVMYDAWGNAGATFIAWMIACSAFGALNGYILTGGRILYAIGKDHALFARLGQIDPTHHTPALALWVNAAIAVVLVFTKTFDQIMTYSTVAISIFFAMVVFGVIVLRRRHPELARPYKTFGYPVTPILFCVTMIGFIANLWIEAPKDTAFGFVWMAVGVPLYWWSQRLR
ncbi:MAG: amino acid permease [Candidatus Omnitrophica bacterium]|nr:amino acid permease [Candidatus Omnitrophota bacterium]